MMSGLDYRASIRAMENRNKAFGSDGLPTGLLKIIHDAGDPHTLGKDDRMLCVKGEGACRNNGNMQ